MAHEEIRGTSGATAKLVKLEPLPDTERGDVSLLDGNLQLIRNLKVKLSVCIGKTEVSVGELFALRDGSVLKLDKLADDPVELMLDGKVVAVGNLVVVDDNFGISITAIGPQKP